MRSLPAPLKTIEVPRHFAVSALGERQQCFAKSAYRPHGSSVGWAPLPSGPWAAKGTLAHRVLEAWTKSGAVTDPASVFAQQFEQLRTELESDPAHSHFAALPDVLGRAEWNSFRAWVLDRCADAVRVLPPTSVASRGKVTTGRSLTGVEVSLSSDSLRLRGRADRIRRTSRNRYEIRDYKTGTVVDDNDEVTADTGLQLEAYGLMLSEADPTAEIALVVDVGREYAVVFDTAAQEIARRKIGAITTRFPAAGEQAMVDVAVPGRDCLGCRIRQPQ